MNSLHDHRISPVRRFSATTPILVLLFSVSSFAQTGTSISSRFGIGDLNLMTSVRQRGMGSAGTALLSESDLGRINPASWGGINAVRLQGELQFENVSSEMTGGTSSATGVGIQSLHLALPFLPERGVTMTLGFQPFSRTDFMVRTRGDAGGEAYSLEYRSEGGVSLFQVGASIKPTSTLYVGASYNFHLGNISQQWDVTFDNGTFFNTAQSRVTTHNGSTFTFGAIYAGIRDLTLGASFTTGTDLRISRDAEMSYSTHDSTIISGSGSISLPLAYSIGASYRFDDRFLASVDFTAQDWSGTSIEGQPADILSATRKISGGIEYVPSSSGDASFFSRSAYRFGLYHRASYIALGGESSDEFFLTAGIGFPLGGFSRTDISFEYGWRGESSNRLGKDTMLRLCIGINASEFWFIRRESED